MNKVNLKNYIKTLETGKRPKGGSVSSGIVSLGGEHINAFGGFNLQEEKLKYVPNDYFESLTKGIIQKNDILVVKDGATTGKVAYVEENFRMEKACINEHVFLIRTKDSMYSKYLFYFLFSEEGQRGILNDFRGATVGGISREFINMDIYLPEINIQKKIVKILERAQELVSKRKEQIEALDELVKSKFIEMFGDPLINNKGFSKIKIKDVIDTKILKASKVYKGDEQISYIDISCIDNLSNKIISHNEYLFREAPSRAQQCIEKDDILISTVRPNLRNVAMVEDVFENMVATSGVTVLRSNKINKYFLYKYVLSEYFTNEMVAVTSGANYPAIKSSDIYNHEIIYPPIEMQNEFAKFFKRVDKLKFRMEQDLKEMENNFESLMQRAFNGELFKEELEVNNC